MTQQLYGGGILFTVHGMLGVLGICIYYDFLGFPSLGLLYISEDFLGFYHFQDLLALRLSGLLGLLRKLGLLGLLHV